METSDHDYLLEIEEEARHLSTCAEEETDG
jgi:hypothetical protein